MDKKAEIRLAIKEYFLSPEGKTAIQRAENLQKDVNYCKKFLNKIPCYEKAKTILAYYPLKEEFPTLGLLNRAFSDGKTIALPVVTGKDLIFKKVNFVNGNIEPVIKGCFGILEPSEKAEPIFYTNGNTSEINGDILPLIILVPGRAFGKKGERLGRGGGFYDRFFKKLFQCVDKNSVALIGICFSGQITDGIPMEEFDYFVNSVLTEEL
ncbi:5-formyltetrahydrofolate cyclo-ligase [Treponema pedis]|uniref:5-formyltetrahydrofolate cyclo-ligase n=1 Tax=Treponema pedis TaxID=409322 RepID=UPI00041237E0|nr:5-formyltetrahydrofolate cyclo-ligase [Treponema pedis]QSI03893.1 5-formyltetrahydrofolate cyclo-ligase [Treponema pedis]